MSVGVKVEKALVLNGDVALLAKDKSITDLLPNQMGFFTMEGVSFDSTVSPAPHRWFLAMKNSSGKIVKSAGQAINNEGMKNVTFRCYSPEQLQKFEVKIKAPAECETEYGIRLKFEGANITKTFGEMGYTMQHMVTTGCCADKCTGCGAGNVGELAWLLSDSLNTNSEGLVISKAYQEDGTTELVDKDAAIAYTVANPTATPVIKFEIQATQVATSCGYNINRLPDTALRCTVSFIDDLGTCNATVTEIQSLAYEIGGGYALSELEEGNGALEGNGASGAYRQRTDGFMKPFIQTVKGDGKYVHYVIESTDRSQSANLYYNADSTTHILCEVGNTAITDIVTILDAILPSRFVVITDDVAACQAVTTTKQIGEFPDNLDGIAGTD